NPADHVTRGLTIKTVAQCDLWLHGPPITSLYPIHAVNAIQVRPSVEQKASADEKLATLSFERLLALFEFLLEMQNERYGAIARETDRKSVQYSLSQFAVCRVWVFLQRIRSEERRVGKESRGGCC